MLPNYSGKADQYQAWRFRVTQFVSEDSYFPTFLDWIEGLGDEATHAEELEKLNEESQDQQLNMQDSGVVRLGEPPASKMFPQLH